jgi:hypothetical protein
MHSYTHIHITKEFLKDKIEYTNEEKEWIMIGSILPDFYLFRLSRLYLLTSLIFKIKHKTSKKEFHNFIHSKKDIEAELATNTDKAKGLLLYGMKIHLYTDDIAHEELIYEQEKLFSNDFDKNHFLLEKQIDLAISDDFSEYRELSKKFNYKKFKVFSTLEINDKSFIYNLTNFYIWKMYFLYKIHLENKKSEYKFNSIQYVSRSIEYLNKLF